MLFKKDSKVSKDAEKSKADEWYNSLDDRDRMILSRYSAESERSLTYDFFMTVIKKALDEGNHKFAVKMCNEAYANVGMDEYQRFLLNEYLVQAYFLGERYDDTKAACDANLELYPLIKDKLKADNNGQIPERLYFRNRYIDVIVGIECAYDLADEMLVKYNQMGLLSDEDLVYRRNSLKTHRLQKLFDGVYTYRPKGE